MPALWATSRNLFSGYSAKTELENDAKKLCKSVLSLLFALFTLFNPKNALWFCQWDCSLRSSRFFSLLALRDVSRRDERDSGEKVPGGESEERRLYSQATWSRDTDNFGVRFVPPVIFPQVSHITTEFYLNILLLSNFIVAIWLLTLICFLHRYWWMCYWNAQVYCTWHMQ